MSERSDEIPESEGFHSFSSGLSTCKCPAARKQYVFLAVELFRRVSAKKKAFFLAASLQVGLDFLQRKLVHPLICGIIFLLTLLAKEDEYDRIYVSGTGIAVPWNG